MPARFLLFFLLAICMAVNVAGQPVKIHGQLSVSGTRLVDKNHQPIALHGMSFSWHNWWPRFYTAGVVKDLYEDWNCSVIRAAMGVEPENGYIKDPAGSTQKIKTVVEAAIQSGIYVIIDWHSHNVNLPEAKIFFTEMATQYGKYPNIIYELFNEPDKESWKEVKDYATEVIATIRTIDAHNIILVGSPHWDQDIHLPAEDPIKGYDNLMYTVHFYAGTHKQWLRDRTDAAIKKGIPVFVSESAGTEATGDGPIDKAEWQKWIDWMDERNLSWITWSISDKNESSGVVKPSAGSDGQWALQDLKESGILTRDYFRKYPSVKK